MYDEQVSPGSLGISFERGDMMSLAEIDKRIQGLYEQWSSLQPLSPENDKRLWKKIRLEWNYHSNRIERNALTYEET